MRAAPIGLARPLEVDLLCRDAALSAVVTHADPTAVLSAVAMAYMVADLLHTRPGEIDVVGLLDRLKSVLEDLPDPPILVRKPGGGTVRLLERLLEMGDRLDQEPADLFAYTYNGALVTESLPAGLWCFLRSPDEPERVLITAVNQGYDADTVAAMAGAMVGAYNGAAALPDRWLDELEYRDASEGCADDLLDLAGLPAGPAVGASPSSSYRNCFVLGAIRLAVQLGPDPHRGRRAALPDGRACLLIPAGGRRRGRRPDPVDPHPLGGAIERRREVRAHSDWATRKTEVMKQLLAAKFTPGTKAGDARVLTGALPV